MAPPSASRPGRTLAALALILVVMYAVVAANAVFGKGSWAPKLGLDLEGGTSVTLLPKLEGQGTITDTAINEAVSIIRNRVDARGVAEAEVVAQGSGNNRAIVVSIPGPRDEGLIKQLTTTAQLRFRPVLDLAPVAAAGMPAPSGEPTPTATPSSGAAGTVRSTPGATPKAPSGASAVPATPKPSATTNGRAVPKGLQAATTTPTPAPSGSATPAAPASPKPSATSTAGTGANSVPAEVRAKFEALKDCKNRPGDVPANQYMVACSQDGAVKYLLAPADVVGTDLSSADAGLEQTSQGATTGNWEVQLNFDSQGGKKFADSTTRLSQLPPPQNQFAIVLDGEVVSAPALNNGPITGGRASITGSFTQKEATDLANVLKFGALPLSFEAGAIEGVSPTLGADQLRGGLIAGAIGLGLVVLYSLLYYRGLGIVSIFSLLVSTAITYAAVVILGQQIGFRLSLAGVAGLIVAIGITADSFIVYFERLRDEMREGRTLRVAVEVGWTRARRTILAADFVSFLAAVILYVLSIGSVKGFAFTLGLTTLIDVLVVFLFTKPVVTLLARRRFFAQGHRMSGLDPKRIGGRVRTANAPSTPIVARRAAAAAGHGGSAGGSKEA